MKTINVKEISHPVKLISAIPLKVKNALISKASFFFWALKGLFLYAISNFKSISKIYKNYFLLIIGFLLAIPWLSNNTGVSIVADILSLIGFVILMQDKVQHERNQIEESDRIKGELLTELQDICAYLNGVGVGLTGLDAEDIVTKTLNGVSDYNYFDDHRYKYLSIITDLTFKGASIDDELVFCLKYFVFSQLKTKYRHNYVAEHIDVTKILKSNSKENKLLRFIAYHINTKSICLNQDYLNQTKNLEAIASVEFGETVSREAISKIINDKEKAERFRDLITRGIERGLISEKGLESITRNRNNLFVVLKYGEGTSQGWPKKESAPLGKVLKKNGFEIPFYQEKFVFIRDLNEAPIDTDVHQFVEHILEELRVEHKILKDNSKYRNVKVIQDGPHYELIAFIADKKNLVWRLSRKRSFNSFVNKLIINEALASDYSQEFVRANYFRLKTIVEEISWFSLLTNDKLREAIVDSNTKIDSKFSSNKIRVSTLFDVISLSSAKLDILKSIIFDTIKSKNISARKKRTSDLDKRKVINGQVEILVREASLFVNMLRELKPN